MKLVAFASRLLHRGARFLDVSTSQKEKSLGHVFVPESSRLNLAGMHIKKDCHVELGEKTQVVGCFTFDKEDASIKVGSRTFVNGTVIVASSVSIGDDVLISWNVTIVDHNSHSVCFSQRSQDAVDWLAGKKDWKNVKTAPVNIQNKVWIGFNSIILKGVTVGEGAIVGAGSVVTKDVPPWTIVAGNPARIIREIPEHER